jgi:hypothetical protein
VVTVILALVLRLWKLRELFYFTMDESLIAFRALGLFEYGRPFLIGGISPLQIHLPPYFYYLESLLLAPFKFDPAGWGIWGALLGGLTTVALFGLARRVANARTALFAAVIYAFSQVAVFADRHFWPLSFNPLITLLSLLFLKTKNYWGLSLTLVLAVTADPSNLPLALVMLLGVIYVNREKWKKIKKPFLTSALLFLTPLILFDIRHQGVNVKGLAKLFSRVGESGISFNGLVDGLLLLPKVLTRLWYAGQTNVIEMLSYCFPHAQARQQVPLWLLLLALSILVWSFKKLPRIIRWLLLAYVLGISLFGFLGYSIFDHYFTSLLPLLALMTAMALTALPKRLGTVLIWLFILVNLWQIFTVTNPYGLGYKQELVNWANQELGGRSFRLDSESKCHKENGLRYLFEVSGNPPAQSFMDPYFSWLYQNSPSTDTPEIYFLVTDKEEVVLSQPPLSFRQFGAMKALIMAEPVVSSDSK